MRRSTRKRKPPARLEDNAEKLSRTRQPPSRSQTPPPQKALIPPCGPTQQHGLYSLATASPNSHTSTPRAPTLPARASTTSPVAAIPPQADTAQQCLEQDIKLINRQDKTRRSTRERKPPVRLENLDKTALRKRQPQATPPHRAPVLQRETKRQCRSSSVATSSSRPPTTPTRAPTPPHVISIPPQLFEQNIPLVNEQVELEMTKSSDIEICRKAIIKNFVALKQYLHPDPIIDCETGFGLLTVADRKNIKGKDLTDKNEMILKRVISKRAKGYTDFKERLRKTWQTDLLELIVCAENGQDTQEIKSRLEKTALLSPEYIKHRGEVKDGLFKFYKTRHSKIFLSPLFEEKDTALASFYIRPELSSIVSTSTRNDEKIPVESLSELFKTKNIENREIYVLADAGLGKTAFSKYLANVWCQAHCPDEDLSKLLLKDDVDCMQEFDFLFLVLLRDSDDLCFIDELIFEKIVSNLGLEETLSKDILLKILKNEKCLIILDGLDEWTHPDKKCYRSPRSIPHRNEQKKCTLLTTTRPWKLGVLDLNSCQIGKKVEITQLSNDSAVTLIRRILQRLKSHHNKDLLESEVDLFIHTINRRRNDELAFVPLLLIYTICLWCEGVQIGDTKCDLYINIVELLLSRTIQIHGELQQSWELSSSDIPECFDEYETCQRYYPLLLNLGKLAYYALFNETKENTLVFDGSVARKYIAQDEMKFTLHSGMLSESTSKTLTKTISKVSFPHKTFQEFFAAIFISSQSDAQKPVLEKCRNVEDIRDMSQMCEFMSKMNVDLMCAISNDLMSVINEVEKTRDYRTWTGYQNMYNTSLYDIQKMFMSCLQEMPESENVQLCLQDFFINEQTEHSNQLQRLLKQNKTNIKSLYIDISNTSSSLRKIIDLFSLTDLSHIQKLVFRGNWKEDAEINRILFPRLQNITLLDCEWANDEENLSENLARLQNLQYLYIFNITLSHKILETFFNVISCQKSLKELTLYLLNCKNHDRHDCKRLNLDLSQHSTLAMVNLQMLPRLLLNISTPSLVNVTLLDINLDEGSLLLSRDMLNIEHVRFFVIEMSAGSLHNYITVLENLRRSVTVKMDDIEPETEYKSVKGHIRRSQTFHMIEDDTLPGAFEFKTIKPSKK
ncbi:uncharacterized protein LOC132759105 [Ruditapes philippinarum]|uniref:uncharacterized protein LOC132759105 n=1 Tax=Ruditapes philippinarum TaxID=129788 RepID=UPI00295BA11F|nr:uncharacterized protein LOC132759105 [Ruditapes philippinarum]